MSEKLTDDQVLSAVARAVCPYSAYINDVLQRDHAAHVKAGGKGFPPSSGLVLRRLRSLERRGLIECVEGPIGLYGYTWGLTETGITRLAEAS